MGIPISAVAENSHRNLFLDAEPAEEPQKLRKPGCRDNDVVGEIDRPFFCVKSIERRVKGLTSSPKRCSMFRIDCDLGGLTERETGQAFNRGLQSFFQRRQILPNDL